MRLGFDRVTRRRHRYEVIYRGTAEGQAELADMVRRYHILAPITVAEDPISSAYRDGQRSVVVEILRTLGLTPAELIDLRQAATQDDKDDAQ